MHKGGCRCQAQRETPPRKRERIACFHCGIYGQFTNKCPEMKKQLTSMGDENQIHTLNATWEASIYRIQMMRETL
jgi:hypothetical protein